MLVPPEAMAQARTALESLDYRPLNPVLGIVIVIEILQIFLHQIVCLEIPKSPGREADRCVSVVPREPARGSLLTAPNPGKKCARIDPQTPEKGRH